MKKTPRFGLLLQFLQSTDSIVCVREKWSSRRVEAGGGGVVVESGVDVACMCTLPVENAARKVLEGAQKRGMLMTATHVVDKLVHTKVIQVDD